MSGRYPKTTSMTLDVDVQTFEVNSGALQVTDPCYEVDTWCAGKLENVKNGTWFAKVGYYKDPQDGVMFNNYLNSRRESVKLYRDADANEIADVLQKEIDADWGKYEASEGRVSVIGIQHISCALEQIDKWELEDIHVGVDSGQAGFFDYDKYAEALSDKVDNDEGPKFEAFYEKSCNCTGSDLQFGVIDNFGVVSSSGYGDGGYELYVARNAEGQVIGAYITFISEDDVKENEEEEEEAA